MTNTNIKLIIRIVVAAVLLLVVIISLRAFHNSRCDRMDITILDADEVKFIDNNEVSDILYGVNPNIIGYRMDSVDLFRLQDALKLNPYIRKSSMYKTVSGVLKVDIQQRKPILMVMGERQNYYIDGDGCVFGTNKKYHSKTIVASGSITDFYDFSKEPLYKIDLGSDMSKGSVTADLFKLTQLIMADDFWRDQIEQIYVTSKGEYELVPMMGAHILALGTMDDYDYKMYVLKQFYLRALSKVGWDTYKLISVKYSGQIVCKKK